MVGNHSTPHQITWAIEQSLWQIFQYLIDCEKQPHNAFQLSTSIRRSENLYGPFLYLDNDRGRWDQKIPFYNSGACMCCKFPKQIVERMISFKDMPLGHTLGELLAHSLSFDPLGIVQFGKLAQDVLHYRLEQILKCVEYCLEQNPEETVLFTFDQHVYKSQDIFDGKPMIGHEHHVH
jgi:hypothetical protein